MGFLEESHLGLVNTGRRFPESVLVCTADEKESERPSARSFIWSAAETRGGTLVEERQRETKEVSRGCPRFIWPRLRQLFPSHCLLRYWLFAILAVTDDQITDRSSAAKSSPSPRTSEANWSFRKRLIGIRRRNMYEGIMR